MNTLEQITQDLTRRQTQTLFQEEINFRCDSGYDLQTLYLRALASCQRAFKHGSSSKSGVGFELENLPLFSPGNKLRITIEVIAEEPSPKVSKP